MTVRPLSAALLKKAEEELNETPSRIADDIKILRDWLSQQPHLHYVQPSDQWLVAFLRGCKYNIEKAKGKIDMYYKLKATVPDFYENRDPLDPGIQEILKLGVLLPLKQCMYDDSPRILLTRVGPFSESTKPLTDLIKVALMICEVLLLEDDNFTISGEDVIVDAKGISFGIVWQWTPSLAMKVVSCSEKALSVRLKSMHLLNTPFFLGPALNIFKMFLGSKLRNRIHSHAKDLETLYEHFDKRVLPEEYGGTAGTLQELIESKFVQNKDAGIEFHSFAVRIINVEGNRYEQIRDYWKTKIESHRQWFVEENISSDESKRPNNKSGLFNNTKLSFKSTEID